MSKVIKITLASLLAIILVAVAVFIFCVLREPNIYSGVTVKNVSVGGLDKKTAEKRLKDTLQKKLEEKEMLIVGEGYSENFSYKELDVSYDYKTAVDKAYKLGRDENIITRLKDIYDIRMNGKDVDLEIVKNKKKIKEVVDQVDEEVSTEKIDATIKLGGGGFVFTDEVVGKVVDSEKLEKKLDASIDNYDSVDIPIKLDQPQATRELLSKVREELGSYTTKFTTNDQNRVFNIQKSSNSINDMVILPGDTFSFNSTTGPRSLKAGYKEATVIMNGEFVPGEGGGVCQVSSTLYNTIANSGVEIVERHKHSKPIGYVPPGQDATVAYDILDFKFKNNYKAPIYIQSSVGQGTLTIKLYGNKEYK